MVWLEQGDRLPMVAVVQELLRLHEQVAPKPEVDGIFGGNTKAAVVTFQRLKGLAPNGVVGPATWGALTQGNPRPIGDVVDTNHDAVRKLVQAILVPLGSTPYNPPFLSNALELVARHVQAQAKDRGKLYLLRLYGHGNWGQQNLSTGLGGHWMNKPGATCNVGETRVKKGLMACVYPIQTGETLNIENFDLVERCFRPLRDCFAPLGSVELHGCEIARAKKGQMLLFRLALFLGVPVTAAIKGNRVGTQKTVLRVERPSTWFPLAGDLVSWAKGRYRELTRSVRGEPATP